MNDRTFLELDAVDEAADARADLNLLHRLKTPGELVPLGDRALDRLRDCHRRRRRRGRLRLRLLVAARERQREQQTDRCAAASWKAMKRTAIELRCRSRLHHSISHTHFRLSKDPGAMIELHRCFAYRPTASQAFIVIRV